MLLLMLMLRLIFMLNLKLLLMLLLVFLMLAFIVYKLLIKFKPQCLIPTYTFLLSWLTPKASDPPRVCSHI